MKICSKCKIARGFEEFSKDNTKKCGFRSDCKQCYSVVKAKNYAKNSEKIKERIYKFSHANYEKVSQTKAKYKAEHSQNDFI